MNGWALSESATFPPTCSDTHARCQECESFWEFVTRTFESQSLNSNLSLMWDTKRQIIWLVAGISFGTFIVYNDARDEFGRVEVSVFVFWEIVLLAIILTLFWLYSRKKT